MLRRETIHYDQDGYDVSITVSRATVLIGINRSRFLRGEDEHVGKEADVMTRWCWQVYSDCMAATVEVVNAKEAKVQLDWDGGAVWPDLPFPLEQFLGLPEQLVYDWRDTILDLNPHWAPWRLSESDDVEGDQSGEASGGEK